MTGTEEEPGSDDSSIVAHFRGAWRNLNGALESLAKGLRSMSRALPPVIRYPIILALTVVSGLITNQIIAYIPPIQSISRGISGIEISNRVLAGWILVVGGANWLLLRRGIKKVERRVPNVASNPATEVRPDGGKEKSLDWGGILIGAGAGGLAMQSVAPEYVVMGVFVGGMLGQMFFPKEG